MHSALRVLIVPMALTLTMMLTGCAPAEEAPAEAAAQEAAPVDDGALAADLVKDWAGLKETMMTLGDAMPAENFDYKPTDELRTFGEQLMHITGSNARMMAMLEEGAMAPDLGEPTSKEDVLQAVATAFDFGSGILEGKTNAWASEVVAGPGYLGDSTRARLVYRAMAHTWSEYGAMTVYLRLNEIVPPASR